MHVDAGGDEARLERRLEHVAREARVLADQHRAALGRQHPGRRARQLQREVDGHRVLAHAPAHAVGAEIPSTQLFSPHHGGDNLQCLHRRGDVVRADDARAAERREHRERDAAMTRSPGGQPVSVPTMDLRDKPTNTGSPGTVSSRRCRSSVRLCARVLPKPNPGSMTMRARADAGRRGRPPPARPGRPAPRRPHRRSAGRLHGARLAPACASGTAHSRSAAAA